MTEKLKIEVSRLEEKSAPVRFGDPSDETSEILVEYFSGYEREYEEYALFFGLTPIAKV